jgi:putative restriction endonuclease
MVIAELLFRLTGPEASRVAPVADQTNASISPHSTEPDTDMWEHHLEQQVERNQQIDSTERDQLIMARRRRGLFKEQGMRIERRCRISLVETTVHFCASHSKPWRDSNDEERKDGENGLPLAPSIDHLSDGGFISFEGSGELIVSPVAHNPSLERMGVITNV